MARVVYTALKSHKSGYLALLALNALVILIGLGAAWYMEHNGHIVTGMNNRIVWGTPHVFAVFLIIAASGALNVASISSVFNQPAYKRYARLSGLIAVALLIGGLTVLVLDLGRPDRLIVAMTTYNFKSIFAWNIYLYTGFIVVVGIYLWLMMSRTLQKYSKAAGWAAFIWRLALTTGTGSIFGFLVAREAYDTAVLAPLFIAGSLAYGLAFTILVLAFVSWASGQALMDDDIVARFRNLLMIFIGAVLYFTAAQHLTNIYATEHHGVERFLLLGDSIYPALFWGGQIFIGSLLPLIILAMPTSGPTRGGIVLAALLVLVGGLAQIYVIIIGGQAYPLTVFPGWEVESGIFATKAAEYTPSLPEVLLGVSGIAIAMFMIGFMLKVLPFLPESEGERPPRRKQMETAPQVAE